MFCCLWRCVPGSCSAQRQVLQNSDPVADPSRNIMEYLVGTSFGGTADPRLKHRPNGWPVGDLRSSPSDFAAALLRQLSFEDKIRQKRLNKSKKSQRPSWFSHDFSNDVPSFPAFSRFSTAFLFRDHGRHLEVAVVASPGPQLHGGLGSRTTLEKAVVADGWWYCYLQYYYS